MGRLTGAAGRAWRWPDRGAGWVYTDIVDQLLSGGGVNEQINADGLSVVHYARFGDGGQRLEGPFGRIVALRGDLQGSQAQFAERHQVCAGLLLLDQQLIAEINVVGIVGKVAAAKAFRVGDAVATNACGKPSP